VKAYSGYVKLPKSQLADLQDASSPYDAHIFFWYFRKSCCLASPNGCSSVAESRNDPGNAPTTIYLAGGPGTSAFDSSSGFPCNINSDSNSTTRNELSWNNNVNMLYIDQPVGTGFSYSSLADGTFDLLAHQFIPNSKPDQKPQTNLTTLPATLNAINPLQTINNTAQAAKMLYRFSQVWFQE
jgi:hypothetical protein